MSTSTAVIYTGQARTFAHCFKSQYFQVLRKLSNPTFFVSVADDEDADSMRLLESRFPPDKVHYEKVKQPEFIPPPWTHANGDLAGNSAFHASYPPSADDQGILKQLWALARGWEFLKEQANPLDFDYFLRIRPDLAFHRFEFDWYIGQHIALTPWWARWGGVNDRVAVLGRIAAEAYFTAFNERQAMFDEGCPLHPETLINYALERKGCNVCHTLPTEFTTVRKNNQHVPPSITVPDFAEYARTGGC